MGLLQTIKKYPKDTLLVAGVILIAFFAVSADGFSDLANRRFWWNFWTIIHVASILFCIGGWTYLYVRDKSRGK